VDYFLRPKPAYFTIARELRPYTVGMTRKEKKTYVDDRSAANFIIETVLEVWGTNKTLTQKEVKLEVTFFDLQSEWKDQWSKDVTLAPNQTTELYAGELSGQPARKKLSDVPKTIIVSARLLDKNSEVLGRYSNW
jgi:beta-mannosidase